MSTYSSFLQLKLLIFVLSTVNAVNNVKAIKDYSVGSSGSITVERYGEKDENFCIVYFPKFSVLPISNTKTNCHVLQRETTEDFCMPTSYKNFTKKVVLITDHGCNISQQASAIQVDGGVAVIFTPKKNFTVSRRDDWNVSIPVILVNRKGLPHLHTENDTQSASVCLYVKKVPFDFFRRLLIWILPVFVVIVGGYWSGHRKVKLYTVEAQQNSVEVQNAQETVNTKFMFYIIPLLIFCMIGMLLLLYYFYSVMIFVVITLYVLLAMNCLYSCLMVIAKRFLPNCWVLFKFKFMRTEHVFDYRVALILIISISIPTTWVVLRHEYYTWILQDILGISICISLLQISSHFPNLKLISILTIALMIYDIFFVYITPSITSGKSIMEQAVGIHKKEKIPLVLLVPSFINESEYCSKQDNSLIGFGDMFFPGLIISYCCGFDKITKIKYCWYFVTAVCGYCLGLLLVFVVAAIYASAQPALLFLIPFTLIPTLILGWYRKELKLLWNGIESEKVPENKEMEVACTTSNPDR